MSQRPYQICVRCVMDTTYPETTFDEQGVCNFCRKYDEDARRVLLPADVARQRLNQIIADIRTAGRGREYDCLLGLSGGVDSSYLAIQLKTFGLRTLAVQFDNGWNTELAVKNIEQLCKQLDMDLFTYVVDWEEFRELQVAFLRASVANVEAPSDHGIFAALYRVADQRGIKYIINGNNFVTEQLIAPSYGYTYKDLRQIRGILRAFSSRRLRTYPQMGLFKLLYYQKIKGIRSVSLLNYMPYNKAEAIQQLERQVGWRYYGGKHHESIITRFHQSYILPTKFGIDKRRGHLSTLIHSGQLTRAAALDELAAPPCAPTLIEEDREYVAKKLNLTDEEFDRIMAEPPKTYRDYPNDEGLYHAVQSLASWRRHLLDRFMPRRAG